MFYQFVWTNSNENDLEENIPLLWNGVHIKRMGWTNNITLIFLKGFTRLSSNYKETLKSLGYNLLDCENIVYDILNNGYPELTPVSDTLKFWFLRWNVLLHLLKNGNISNHIIHIDGDIVFMSDPEKIREEIMGKTFVLQGCPAFTSISDMTWLTIWEKELKIFLKNRSDCIDEALKIRRAPVRSNEDYCNDITYGNGKLEHDQDLIQYLIASGKIPQNSANEVYNSIFYWIQNPLFPGLWSKIQRIQSDARIKEINGNAFAGYKRVPFYHFQNDFCTFCFTWLIINKLQSTSLLIWKKLINKNTGEIYLLKKVLGLFIGKGLRKIKIGRKTLYEKVFQVNNNTDNLYITDIINSFW